MREKKELNIEIGEQVKAVREQSKLTQEKLAERLDVSPQYISDLERGVVGISIATLKKLCCTLHISSDRILFAEKPKNDITSVTDKLQSLPKKQFDILQDIIDKFLQVIDLKN